MGRYCEATKRSYEGEIAMTPKILVIDGMNMFHRARSGFAVGDWPVVYNFLRQFRALVELHSPTRVYVAMEGVPVKRRALLKEYKANRIIDTDDEKKIAQTADFFRQVDVVRFMLETSFPVSVVWHPFFEADDTIYNLIKRSSSAIPWVVASNDSDFTQLLNEFEHVKVYNPMQKTYVEKPVYDYVHWKALRGDPSDNIPKVPGMSDKKAEKALTSTGEATSFLNDPKLVEQWRMNCELIRFHTWSDEEAEKMTASVPEKDWKKVKSELDSMGFKSITNDKSWEKFVSTFDHMWGDG